MNDLSIYLLTYLLNKLRFVRWFVINELITQLQ